MRGRAQMAMTGRVLARLEYGAIGLVIAGVVLATITDTSVTTNVLGVLLSMAAILFSAVYQVCAPCSLLLLLLLRGEAFARYACMHACMSHTYRMHACIRGRRASVVCRVGRAQVWIGTKQKELQAGSMQLMHQYCPWAAGLLAVLVPIFEPMGFADPRPDTILGYDYTPAACVAIAGSAVRFSAAHRLCCHDFSGWLSR
jgi:hypothetical protein